jgi:hypothetical protein
VKVLCLVCNREFNCNADKVECQNFRIWRDTHIKPKCFCRGCWIKQRRNEKISKGEDKCYCDLTKLREKVEFS